MKQWQTLYQFLDNESVNLYKLMLIISKESGVDINDLMLRNDDYPEIGHYDAASEEYRKAIRELLLSDIRNAKAYIEAVKEKRYVKNGKYYSMAAGNCYYGGYTQPPTVERGEEMLRTAIQKYNEEFPEDPYKE